MVIKLDLQSDDGELPVLGQCSKTQKCIDGVGEAQAVVAFPYEDDGWFSWICARDVFEQGDFIEVSPTLAFLSIFSYPSSPLTYSLYVSLTRRSMSALFGDEETRLVADINGVNWQRQICGNKMILDELWMKARSGFFEKLPP
ncbi:hypothetical protein Droror1_Dr00004456 [Drosera rotundifolia]